MLSLQSEAGQPGPLVRPGRSLILLLLHGGECGACLAYCQTVAADTAELASWNCDLAVCVAAHRAHESQLPISPLRFFYDAEGRVQQAAEAYAPALLVIDQWRDIHEVYHAGDRHTFPKPSDLLSWARYLGTQCPECEGEAL